MEFNLPDGYDEKQLNAALADGFSFSLEQSVVERLSIYDTFDWRLFKHSLLLYQSGANFFLRRLSDAAVLQTAEFETQPIFAWDLPDGKLKKELAAIVKMRAILKLAEIHSRCTIFRILNRDEKTVVSLVYEEIRSSPKDAQPLIARVRLNPVRGYPGHFRRLANHLKEIGSSAGQPDDVYLMVLEAVGQKPGSYSTKPTAKLEPEMRSDEATKIILRFLLQVIKSNEEGVKDDIDTEFLHDFRVAVRRTRSALSQVRYVFAPEVTERFKRDFAFIGECTNQLRDLDVYLLRENDYRVMLPPALRDAIDPLFDYLRDKRSKALQDVIASLNSADYARILGDWEMFLDEPAQDPPVAVNSALPIIDLARSRIYKIYRRAVKSGNLILENAEDEMLHALRIECKKLRYLIEFFANLFPPQEIAELTSQLKRLQDNLGDFNDLCIQEEHLLTLVGELPVTDSSTPRALVAVGSLVGALENKRRAEKDAFAETFRKFSAPKNRELFRELFAPKKKKADQ